MTDFETINDGRADGFDLDRPLPLPPLVFVPDGDDVTIGRTDTDQYGIFPPDGAELVRRLADGASPRDAASWYHEHYGERIDIEDIVAALDELGLIGTNPDQRVRQVRWQKLGAALFSLPAFACYAILIGWAVVTMVRAPELAPNYRHVFFTDLFTVIHLSLFVVTIPLLLLHESFHALAGRRLGLQSRLRLGHRLYFIVLETSLDGLVGVPRNRRYLPILAGMLADLLVIAACTVIADLLRAPDGSLTLGGRFLLAVAFTTLLRVTWQFSFYLQTDLYVFVSTSLGCVDLHTTAARALRNRVNRLLGRHHRVLDESDWHPVDRRVARWYAWLILAGYVFSLSIFAIAILPLFVQLLGGVLGRLTGAAVDTAQFVDSAVYVGLGVLQLSFVAYLTIRDRRRRSNVRQLSHVLA